MLTFINPRLEAKFEDWPIGGSNRGQCVFKAECGGNKGWRVTRTTTDKNGRWCKPKADTYATRVAIVDGDDGKTYILKYAGSYDHITINRHDFMNAGEFKEYYAAQGTPRFDELMALIVQAGITTVQ